MGIYFTSDSHFWHKNILDFEKRPYSYVEEMNEGMIQTWNNNINHNDIVYHLGDFSLTNYENTVDVLSKLNGKIVLIKGNHDKSKHYKKIGKLGLLHDYHEVGTYMKCDKQQMWLTHFPMDIGIRPLKWSIHGHIHSTLSSTPNQINVGVDSPWLQDREFGAPIPLEELMAHIDTVANSTIMQALYDQHRLSKF
ncbi:metallo-dependent phosphatase 1 [Bacillus phage SDFMU_Pbc]|uniref:Metallo-dependent phosphatase 1 n=1 Tax=Bacillus phage SDFMU_Pbc TaxID=3076135 RepID=A0AA96KR93_9CAUD|nr:metallo-dependent phosphatase 1 [Bacillus phage SDFMU_Pbc]